MAPDDDWVRAFARQAQSDLNARDILAAGGAEKCHRLHYLQMGAEKICKAHLIKASGRESVRSTHACVAKVLPTIARDMFSRIPGKASIPGWQIKAIRKFAQEIETLAPALDRQGTRADNPEYPWIGSRGSVVTPCEHAFPALDDSDRSILLLIRLIRKQADLLLGEGASLSSAS